MKSPSANTEGGICLPGEQSWELWKHGSGGWTSTQAESHPGAFKTASVFGYPVSAAFAVPIRAATGDEDLLPDIVDFQLEKQNLKPDTPVGQLMDWRLVEREENRTLLLATVLNSEMADDLPKEAPTRFEISPYLYYLPDDHLVIWKELGRLVFAVTRGDQPVYYHALNATTLTVGGVSEIEQLLMPFYTQGIISHLEGIVLWTESVDEGAAEELSRAFGTRVRSERRPKPTLPQAVSPIEPVSVAMEKIRAAKMRRIRNIIGGCLLAYLAIPGFFAVRWFMANNDLAELRGKVNGLQRTYGNVADTLAKWKYMQPTIDADKFPIELFFNVTKALYKANSRVRLLNIEIHRQLLDEGGENITITVKGESDASGTSPISIFETQVKTDAALKVFKWESAPGGTEGTRRTFTLTGNLKADETPTNTNG